MWGILEARGAGDKKWGFRDKKGRHPLKSGGIDFEALNLHYAPHFRRFLKADREMSCLIWVFLEAKCGA